MTVTIAQRIFIVDVDDAITSALKTHLEQEGYVCEISRDPLSFLATVRDFRPDVIVADVELPNLSGLQLCQVMRADPVLKDISFIFVSGLTDVEDRIKGLEAGADDYLSKPYDVRELRLRIEKLLDRRLRPDTPREKARYRVGPLVLDDEVHQLTVEGSEVMLTATEFRLLKALMAGKGAAMSREELLSTVWNYKADIDTRTMDAHIRRIREKIHPHAYLIETVRGVGYRIVDA